jgi:hypothetical protein
MHRRLPAEDMTDSGRDHTGCSKGLSNKAAASEEAKAYSFPYVEPLSEARTPLADFFSILLDRG